ncbi:MAG TPA: flagellar FliJ family protein [Pyrinomonadaceae bacterium]|nr:flagellar FliJ family protein [Pyrinomonadaceae bacterium]
MKKFKFTLQTVHNVREMNQEREQIALMTLQRQADEIVERLAQLEKMQIKAIETYSSKLRIGEAVNIGQMELELNHISTLDRLKRKAQELLKEKKEACTAQQRKLAAAMREVKITKRLRETQETRYNQEVSRQEQTALDEIVAANYARRLV